MTHPVTGDTYEYLELSGDTNGARTTLRITLNKGRLNPNHFHVFQDECFKVLAGTLTIWLEGKTIPLRSGEQMVLPKGKPHNHYNGDDEPVTFTQTVSPALDFEYWEENIIGLTADGKMQTGKMNFIQDLVTLKYLDSRTYHAGIPLFIQKLLLNTVGPIGRRFGYRAIYEKYSGIDK
ncbi:MAG TPA: cupin domain-containing protein [Bacteroidota bacterium]|nr:cupin domain-containing protein [Bacteroidota bacterium]